MPYLMRRLKGKTLGLINHMPSSQKGEEDINEVVEAGGEVEARARADPQMEVRQHIGTTTVV